MRASSRILGGNQDGMALLLTLVILSVILSVSFEINRRVRGQIKGAQGMKAQALLMDRAEAGLAIARALLIKDAIETDLDSVQEDWARETYIQTLLAELGYAEDELSLTITDEMGKIQVNALVSAFPGHGENSVQRKLLEDLLSLFIGADKSRDDRDPAAIVNCLVDWLDSNDNDMITGLSGAESDYYQSLTPPHDCANTSLVEVGQLFRVKGITRDLFNLPEDEEHPLNMIFDKPPAPGDIFTVCGAESGGTGVDKKDAGGYTYTYPGKININTAPVPVIAVLLPEGKQDLAPALAAFREERSDGEEGFTNDLSLKGWYALAAGLTPRERGEMEKKIIYASSIFRVRARAACKGETLCLDAVYHREKNRDGKWECVCLGRRRYVGGGMSPKKGRG